VGPVGLTLLLLCVACSPPVQTKRSLGNDVTIWIESPHAEVRYPDSVRLRVTIRNSGTRPFTMTWPPSFRPDVGCNGKVQREPVELWFQGSTFDKSFESKPYTWRWKPASAPAQLVIQPMSSHVVIDTVFEPPPGVHMLDGGFCARVYGREMSGGARYQGPRS
jgi:hypothetical protein